MYSGILLDPMHSHTVLDLYICLHSLVKQAYNRSTCARLTVVL